MNDRELLELAAKAAGIKIKGYYEDEPSLSIKPGPKLPTARWNPLTDDGDALRLAVTLNIDIEFREGEVWAYRHAFADGECFTATERLADHQPENCGTGCRATRRAIVRAAAEIGKTMP
jgi:hypothetical protein